MNDRTQPAQRDTTSMQEIELETNPTNERQGPVSPSSYRRRARTRTASRRESLTTLLAGAAAAIAVVAILTDDVSSRPSQILITPLDENHPAAAPKNTQPAEEYSIHDNTPSPYIPDVASTSHSTAAATPDSLTPPAKP